MPDNRPIGIFDSGIGGLTIAHAIKKMLPRESVIFLGDTAHVPYGDKSAKSIRHYTNKIVETLFKRNCKLVVIACNTASAIAYNSVYKAFSGKGHIVNVIDPIIDNLAKNPQFSNIGVIGTKRTIGSRAYPLRIKKRCPDVRVASSATPLLAPMIEEGFFNNTISQTIINAYLSVPHLKNIDTLILACTHYPLIHQEIEKYYKGEVKILDCTQVTALAVKNYLEKEKLSADTKAGSASYSFLVTDYTQSFQKTTQIFFGKTVKLEECQIWS